MKGRVLLLMMLSLLCAKMDAGIWGWWRGEKFSENGEYYIYSWNSDVSKRGFLSHATVDGVLRPVLVEASLAQGKGGDLFYSTKLSKSHPLQYNFVDVSYTVHLFENKALGSDQYLKVPFTDSQNTALYNEDSEFRNLLTYGTKSTQYSYNNAEFGVDPAKDVKESDGKELQAYYIFFQKRLAHDRMHLKGYGLNNRVGFFRQTGSGVDDNNCLWLFISKKQYELRIELSSYLDLLKNAAEDPNASEEVKDAYNNAKALLEGETFDVSNAEAANSTLETIVETEYPNLKNLTDELERAQELNEKYEDYTGVSNVHLEEAISAAQQAQYSATSDDDLAVAYNALKTVNDHWDGVMTDDKNKAGLESYKALRGSVDDLNATFKDYTGTDNTALITAKSNAETVAKSANSVEDCNTSLAALQTAYSSLNTLLTNNALDYAYYKQVRLQAADLNYLPSTTDNTTINNADTQAKILAAAESLRGNGISYALQYTNNGGAYKANTKFTLFVKNNSFDRGDYNGWEIFNDCSISSSESATGVYKKGGNYVNSNIDGSYIFNTWEKTVIPYKVMGVSTSETVSVGQSLKQIISNLPNGKYKISVNIASANTDTFLNATTAKKSNNNNKTSTNKETSDMNTVSVDFEITNDDNHTVTLLVQGTTKTAHNVDYMTYYRADNFQLTYLGGATYSLNDNANSTSLPNPGTYEKVESRPLTVSTDTKEVWNTVCLPFAYTKPNNDSSIKIMKLTNATVSNSSNEGEAQIDNVSLEFTEVTEIEAGVPYLIKTTGTTSLISENAVVTNTVADPTNINIEVKDKKYFYNVQMIGTYVKTTMPAGSYFVKSGTDELWTTEVALPIKAFRAYFSVEKVFLSTLAVNEESATNTAKIRMSFSADDGEEITSIDGVEVNNVSSGPIFDLTGRRVENPSKGIYIINGKKYIYK